MTTKPNALNKASEYSRDIINKLRSNLEGKLDTDLISVVTVGSFARDEASIQSDIDFFVIYLDEKIDKNVAETEYNKILEIIKKLGIRMPSDTGAFNKLVKHSEMIVNIGGNDDSNEKLTQRMLYLLECEWLYSEKLYNRLYDEIIEKYVKDGITQHQLCRFLLNDLIRYYRTMCVDFEYKTDELGKSWGDRNIKLLFSRKLLYFSGILTIAETVQHTCETKRNILKSNFMLTPVKRIQNICRSKADKALEMYEEFIDDMSKNEVRELLNRTTHNRSDHSDDFRNFKNKGHHFSWELSRLLSSTYDSSHPIHHAIKF